MDHTSPTRARFVDRFILDGTCAEGMLMDHAISGRLGASLSYAAPNVGAGQVMTPPPMVSVSTAAFGPTASTPPASRAALLSPTTPQGLAFWVGVAALAGLIAIRQSLPA